MYVASYGTFLHLKIMTQRGCNPWQEVSKFELRSPTSVTGSCISVIIAKCQKVWVFMGHVYL